MIEFKLPDIGEGIAEGEIVKWLVAPGAAVAEHQAVVEVMTDKATVEVPAPAAGTVTEFLAAEGDVIPVGQVIFRLDEGATTAAPATSPAESPGELPLAAVPTPIPPQAAAPAAAPAAAAQAENVVEFTLPDIGEGIAEGEIVKWLAQEGESLEEHQPVVEVMTDKATVEIPAPTSGTLTRLLAEAGETVPVGQVIFHLTPSSAGVASTVAAQPAAAASAPGSVPGPASTTPAAAPVGAQVAAQVAGGTRVLAVPSARRVARELGVDLGQVPGSGRNRTIRRKDVEAWAANVGQQPAAQPAAPAAPSAGAQDTTAGVPDQRIPFRGVRRKIAEAMTRSKFTATHFTIVEEIDVTNLVRVRAKAKEIGASRGIKVTYMPFIMAAVADGLMHYRMLNGHLDEEAQEIVNPGTINLGIATDTGNGLMVPVIRNVESKSLMVLAEELGALAQRARDGKVTRDELSGSTFSITNAGNIGGTLATPIINFPDIAILGVHRIVKRPGVVETSEGDKIEVRHYMNLSCSVDHRLADGADAARFLTHMRTLLEEPGLLAL